MITKFSTGNTLYLDIRNENGRSLDFYNAYNDGSGHALEVGDTAASLTVQAYGRDQWPLIIRPSSAMANTEDYNLAFVRFRRDYNKNPILYLEHGQPDGETSRGRFIADADLFAAADSVTKAIGFRFPNKDLGTGQRIGVAWLLKMDYAMRQDAANSPFPASVVPTPTYLDNLFGSIDVDLPWTVSGPVIAWVQGQDKKYVDGENIAGLGFEHIANRVVIFSEWTDTLSLTGNVLFYAAPQDTFASRNNSFVPHSILVRAQLKLLGEDDPFRSERWKNLLSFDYIYDVNTPEHLYYDPTGPNPNGTFRTFPSQHGYAFPNPDKGGVLNGAAPGSILSDLKEAIQGAFTSLTEMPIVFDFIKGPSYVPVLKRQNIRNAQGTLLAPDDPAFDIAPMAKRTGNRFEIQFTDFTLDGTGNNIFFYCGREIGNRGRLGDPSPIAGPIQLINTRPPDSPGVKTMYIQEPNLIDNTGPAVRFEINAYPEVQKVERMRIYRATDAAVALSVRTMALVKTVDLADTAQVDQLSILLSDDFESGFVPYGDPLFYRIVALRKVKDSDGKTEWVPSLPSKLLLTTMIDPINPEAPEITFTSDGLSGSPAILTGVILSWPPTVYNGTYYLDKMSSVGSWVTIYRVKTNNNVSVNLAATDLGTNILPKENADAGQPVYHRFRVRVENSSGLFSLTDKVLTL